ncbi:T9SS type A sorting domain-containing protein (plasmid) [Flammeovirgaceae bacterium SG7u.111]|nr:T9SS type A sorting domain-containing protein [Flammeovirgaceae bacterium SG7u.132]WPO38834.1 T9SS type A sorting domain-containing protein [Flammeovirgaceae bacterium SG7u.111]
MFFFDKKYLFLFAILMVAKATLAGICASVSSGVWGNQNTWNCDGQPAVPKAGDAIVINQGHVVVVNSLVDYYESLSADNLPMGIVIKGILQFRLGRGGATNMSRLRLPENSFLKVEDTGDILFINDGGTAWDEKLYQDIYIGKLSSYHMGLFGDIQGPALIGDDLAILPVELVDFDVASNQQISDIHWATASEWNFSHFELERSSNGVDFIKIAKILSKGADGGGDNYAYSDFNSESGSVYYRLKIINQDGSFSYSKVISIANSFKNEGLVTFPNPAPNGQFSIYFSEAVNKEVDVYIFDAMGREVLAETIVFGKSTFPISFSRELEAGFYTIRVRLDGHTFTKQMIFN